MENERMTIQEVSEIIGDSPRVIRTKCQYGMYDPPICRIQKRPTDKNNKYVFYRSLVERYVGKIV